MCRSMADIRSTAAEIRRGKKKKKEEEERRRKETTGQKYNGPLLHRAAIIKACKWKDTILRFPVSPGSAEAQVTWGEKIKYILIACFLGNTCAKIIVICVCQDYSKVKGGTFFETRCITLAHIWRRPSRHCESNSGLVSMTAGVYAVRRV